MRPIAHRKRSRSRPLARVVFLAAVVALLATLSLDVGSTAAAPAVEVHHGPTARPKIALTFDDNFNVTRSLAVIDVLRRYDVDATMFVTGQGVSAYPRINRAIAEGGFEVGDHSLSHALLTRLSWSSLLREIGGGTSAYRSATGRRTSPLFRPPYGATNSTVASAAGANGFLYLVNWDIDTNDWRGLSSGTIRDHVLQKAHNGAIVLMHLSAPNTAGALPGIITGLRARGYELVTVSNLLKGDRRFLDLAESTALGKAVLRMVAANFMSGYDDNYFGPTDSMTRAQFAKVSVLVAGLHSPAVENADSPTFLDVRPQRDAAGALVAYPFDYVEEAAAAGFLAGRAGQSGQVFDPVKPITRGQLAQVLARMARELKGYPEDWGADGPIFPDVPQYAAAAVAFTAKAGLMTGYSSSRFDTWSSAQRAHVAVVMTRFLDLPQYEAPPPPTTTTTLPPATSTTLPPTSTTMPGSTTSSTEPSTTITIPGSATTTTATSTTTTTTTLGS
ncbi:MAG: polysaccharide deacetylase family protein [Thermoleophilia bacterium]